ncbi:hypothetical protein [Nocardia sp. NPDC006630]|uniref:hypothetical protein n=1 Tax=Nocardia sp. NPDC006630 TaxID=3157181 RepID=UPI00339E42F8
MTVTVESPAPQRPARSTVPWLTVLRFAVVIGCTAVAFWSLWFELIEDLEQGSDIGYVITLPVLALFAAIGIALRHHDELPIYDRQSDIIIGLLGLGFAAVPMGLLVLRYRYEYEVLHLDLVAAPMFLMSVSVLMFGLRPVFRFWPAWLLTLASFPPFYRGWVVALGGSKLASGVVIVMFAAIAAAIGAGRTRRRALAGAAIALATGMMALGVLTVWFPAATVLVYQLIPPIMAVYVSTTIMYFHHRDWSTVRPLNRPVRPLTAAESRSATVVAVVAAGLFALIPVPSEYKAPSPHIPGLVVTETLAAPPGWQLLDERHFPWVTKYFGPDTTWTRQKIRAVRGNPDWDKESRRRRLVVDIVRSDSPHNVDRYPEFTMYHLNQPRVTPGIRVDLGHGVSARLNTVLDDRRLLSWTWLSWNWQGTGGAQRVSLIAADNHLPDAEFPQPEPWAVSNLDNLLHQFLRGNAVTLDPENASGDIDYDVKDDAMLLAVATEMVRIGAGG